ncbi:hypothetical protein F2Q68_00046456 [Brassica cretica]|uniref:GTD-binding domain-containing protein n=1 Tax=Brassica cretica TaxID=69181 RepID=A0A8S9LPY5_BRACR|nr:hypothetical protein F2Q68_00046456 [Brassica cretica]
MNLAIPNPNSHHLSFLIQNPTFTGNRRFSNNPNRLSFLSAAKKPSSVAKINAKTKDLVLGNPSVSVEKGKYSYDVESLINKLSSLPPRGSIARCLDIFKNKLSLNDFALVFKEFAGRGDWQRSLRLFKYMQRQIWCKPNEHIYTIMISLLGREGLLDKCLEVFDEMPSQGVARSVFSYTALINAYGRNGRYETSLELLERMKSEKISPSILTYNTVINACARGGLDWEGLLGLFAPHFYYNDSICDSHKRKVSSLAYCHVHKKLSEIKHMCEGCLLSFATEKESDCDTYKSLIGILHKDLEVLIEDERDLPLGLKKQDDLVQTTTHLIDYKTDSLKQHCSCCGELLKTKSEKFLKKNNSFLAPAPSPRVSYNKLSENESEFKDFDVEERTPSFVRGGNKFFGVPLSDSAQNSPRWSVRSLRKPSLDKIEIPDSNGESILNQLKKEVRLDKKSLIDLYMELDEERSASAVAANNAMAMITKLQAEKSAIQMEALQYQRMMDEQAEYDQEALQSMSSDLAKKEEEFKVLEAEFEAYRERYGCLTDDEASGDEFLEEHGNARADDDVSREEFLEEHGDARADDDCQETKPDSDFEDCSSNQEEDVENIDQNRSCKSEESGLLVQMKKSSEESTEVNGASGEEEKGSVRKEEIVKELSEITERLRALQSDGELLKHIADLSENESEFKDFDVEERTPSFVRGGNKFFGVPLSDSAQNSPRWSVRSLRKPPSLDKIEIPDSNGESILNQLKKEVRLDKKSLIDLYMELDEERSASAVAANNAMAMITKLQAEKSAIQMEALQYQRMMDEQAEYDQEALQSMSSDLAKKEEEFKELEAEFEAYRERYGCLTDDEASGDEFLEEHGDARADDEASGDEFLEEHGNARADDDCQETKPDSDFEDCSSNQEEDVENIDQNRSCKSEEFGLLVQMKKSSEESTEVNGASAEEEKGSVRKEGIVKELSEITERLSALQSDGELLKHIADVSEGEAMILQISQNLHMLRSSFVAMPSES